MDGSSRHTTIPMRSTTEENSSFRSYCHSECSPKSASSEVGASAFSSKARFITVTGLFCTNRSRTAWRYMTAAWSPPRRRASPTIAQTSQQAGSPTALFRLSSRGNYVVAHEVTLKGLDPEPIGLVHRHLDGLEVRV